RRTPGAAADQLAKAASWSLADRFLEVSVKLYALAIEDVSQHDLGVESRAFRPVALQVISRPGQQPPDGPRALGLSLRAWLRRGLLASVHRDISRSPSCSRRS